MLDLGVEIRSKRVEALIMKNHIVSLIRSFQGYTYEVAGVLTAYFEDPEQARACAEKILEKWEKPVEVNGTTLTVYI